MCICHTNSATNKVTAGSMTNQNLKWLVLTIMAISLTVVPPATAFAHS